MNESHAADAMIVSSLWLAEVDLEVEELSKVDAGRRPACDGGGQTHIGRGEVDQTEQTTLYGQSNKISSLYTPNHSVQNRVRGFLPLFSDGHKLLQNIIRCFLFFSA